MGKHRAVGAEHRVVMPEQAVDHGVPGVMLFNMAPGLCAKANRVTVEQRTHRFGHRPRIVGRAQLAALLVHYFREGTVAPSAVRPVGNQMTFYRGEGEYPVPRELGEDEIQGIIRSFADAASHAVLQAGFDGIEIHGANGYLLDQFFTDYTNLRTDCWGGDIAGRLQLSLEVIKSVRQRVGQAIPVGIRISQGKVNDFFHKWANGEDDARIVFTLLAESGIDYLHLTEYEAWQPAFPGNSLSLIELGRKYAPHLTIMANGSLHDECRALQVMEMGADFIALGRGALANHDWPERVANGESVREFDNAILGPIANIKDSELSV